MLAARYDRARKQPSCSTNFRQQPRSSTNRVPAPTEFRQKNKCCRYDRVLRPSESSLLRLSTFTLLDLPVVRVADASSLPSPPRAPHLAASKAEWSGCVTSFDITRNEKTRSVHCARVEQLCLCCVCSFCSKTRTLPLVITCSRIRVRRVWSDESHASVVALARGVVVCGVWQNS